MKIKVIDLLNKIANGEEVPKKIIYKDNVYHSFENRTDLHTYLTKQSNAGRTLSLIIDNEYLNLNDYVEIIEDHILTDEEKKYLSAVIKPFRYKVLWIKKLNYSEEEYIKLRTNKTNMEFPNFKKGTLYKGMELDREYTLEELGL